MSSFAHKGLRKFKLQKQKEALKALNNFADIMLNMGKLREFIEEHAGLVNAETIQEIADKYNKYNNLYLTKEQINIVIKQFV
jgi:hypothetical protein